MMLTTQVGTVKLSRGCMSTTEDGLEWCVQDMDARDGDIYENYYSFAAPSGEHHQAPYPMLVAICSCCA